MNKEQQDLYVSGEETQLIPNNPLDEAPVESPEEYRVSNSGSKREGDRLTARELKDQISFTRLLERDGHTVTSGGKRKKCLCPFHDERTPSFYIYEDDSFAHCYGCDWHGDIYDYEMEVHDVDFYEAFRRLEKKAKYIKRKSPRVVSSGSKTRGCESILKPDQLKVQTTAAHRLANDEWLYTRVAASRDWKPETIRKLAEEGSLGWNQGALAFLYDTGMKLRNWPHRQFVWEFGGSCVWRRKRIGSVQEIYICEGETDAIALLDVGMEDDPNVAVVALASATMITGDLVDLVKDKNVTLCMDNDEAGDIATENLVELLEPVCAELSIFNFEEVA